MSAGGAAGGTDKAESADRTVSTVKATAYDEERLTNTIVETEGDTDESVDSVESSDDLYHDPMDESVLAGTRGSVLRASARSTANGERLSASLIGKRASSRLGAASPSKQMNRQLYVDNPSSDEEWSDSPHKSQPQAVTANEGRQGKGRLFKGSDKHPVSAKIGLMGSAHKRARFSKGGDDDDEGCDLQDTQDSKSSQHGKSWQSPRRKPVSDLERIVNGTLSGSPSW
jgi:hypothetical protein